MPGLTIRAAILQGWLAVGSVDALDAILMTLARGGSPPRMFQGIASGLLGATAFEGGTPTVLLGIAIHYFIAFTVVALYVLASRQLEVLTRRWVGWGVAYGLGVWLVMNFVVIPLSAIHRGGFTVIGMTNQLLIHALGVGLLTAWFARRTRLAR